MRRRARVDANQKEIVAALRKLGFQVVHTHQLGEGYPDLHVARHGHDWLVEVKDGNKPLTEAQIKFMAEWQGKPIVIIRNIDDVLRFNKYAE